MEYNNDYQFKCFSRLAALSQRFDVDMDLYREGKSWIIRDFSLNLFEDGIDFYHGSDQDGFVSCFVPYHQVVFKDVISGYKSNEIYIKTSGGVEIHIPLKKRAADDKNFKNLDFLFDTLMENLDPDKESIRIHVEQLIKEIDKKSE